MSADQVFHQYLNLFIQLDNYVFKNSSIPPTSTMTTIFPRISSRRSLNLKHTGATLHCEDNSAEKLSGLALFDTLDFLLNEYFNELNTANFNILNKFLIELASQDALEVMGVTEWVTHWSLADLTDVTLASDDTFWRLYWYDSGESRYWWPWWPWWPEMMHQRWCTRGDAPEMMHQRWCTRWKEMIVIKAKEVKIVEGSKNSWKKWK